MAFYTVFYRSNLVRQLVFVVNDAYHVEHVGQGCYVENHTYPCVVCLVLLSYVATLR